MNFSSNLNRSSEFGVVRVKLNLTLVLREWNRKREKEYLLEEEEELYESEL